MRKLGKNGPEVYPLGLGCMSMSAFYEADRDSEEAVANIQKAFAAGVNLFDTADMYGDGDNERLIGAALKDVLASQRDKVILATKCGFVKTADGYDLDCSAEYIKMACEASLKNLNVAYIDLYYLHRIDPKVPLKESLGALVELIEAGKIRGIGLSEADAKTIYEAHAFLKSRGHADKFWAIQTEYNLLSRQPEFDGVFEACRKLGVGFVPYSPLSRSLLTGKVKVASGFSEGDFRGMLPRFQGDNLKANLAIVERLKQFAESKHVTLPQLMLSWILAKGDFIIPIPGSRKWSHIESNIQADKVVLSDDDVLHIEKIVAEFGGPKGDRYTAEMMLSQNIKVDGDIQKVGLRG